MTTTSTRAALAYAWRTNWRAGPMVATAHMGLTLMGGTLAAATAWFTKLLIDALVAHGPPSTVVAGVAGLAAVGLVSACEPRVSTYLESELGRRVSTTLTDRLVTAVGSFRGLARFESPQTLDRIRSAQQGSSGAVAPATTGLFPVVRDAVSLVTVLATVALLSLPMAVIVVAAGATMLVAQLSLSRHYARVLDLMAARGRRQFGYSALGSDVQAVKELRVLGLVDFFRQRILATLATANAAQRGLDRRTLRVQTGLSVLAALIGVAGMGWAAWSAYHGRITVGDVIAFTTALAAAQSALASLVSRVAGAHRALVLVGHHVEIVSMEPDLPEPAQPAALGPLADGIELDDVWFRYGPTRPWVLRGVTLRIERGTSLALVGLNGAGKSTLIKLLCRFYDPDRGRILWDGVDIRSVPVTALRERLGVLFQDFMEYDLTVAENIGVGDLARSQDRARLGWAAEQAGMAETVEALPLGYDTLLSRVFYSEQDKADPQTGVTLSGGQWQRIALARTFMRAGRDLMILDEPSAGLDAEAEHEIHQRLRAHRRDRTSVLVSHRLAAVREADRIVVLADGQVIEDGDHDHLMRLDGRYARLFRIQAEGYAPTTS